MKKFVKILTLFLVTVVITAVFVVVSGSIQNKSQQVTEGAEDTTLTDVTSSLMKTTAYSGNLKVYVNGKYIYSHIAVDLSGSPTIKASFNFADFGIGQRLEITYISNTIFVQAGNFNVKSSLANIKAQIPTIKNMVYKLVPDLDDKLNASASLLSDNKFFKEMGININNFNIADLDTSTLQKLLDYISTAKTDTGYNVTANIPDVVSLSANFDNGYHLKGFYTNTLNINGNMVQLSFTSDGTKRVYTTAPTGRFVDFSDLVRLLDATTNTITGTSLKISGNVNAVIPVLKDLSLKFYLQTLKTSNGIDFVALIDNLPTSIYMNTKVYTAQIAHGTVRHYVYLLYKNGALSFERYIDYQQKEKVGGSFFKPIYNYSTKTEKVAFGKISISQLFGSNKTTVSMLTEIFGLGKTITDAINLFDNPSTAKSTNTNLSNILVKDSLYVTGNNYVCKINTASILGNKNFGNLNLNLKLNGNKLSSLQASISIAKNINISTQTLFVTGSFGQKTIKYASFTQQVNLDNVFSSKMATLRYL